MVRLVGLGFSIELWGSGAENNELEVGVSVWCPGKHAEGPLVLGRVPLHIGRGLEEALARALEEAYRRAAEKLGKCREKDRD